MHAHSPKLLGDIRDAAAFIGAVAQGRTLAQYSADRLLRQGVERNFEIIGEAIKRLVQVGPDVAARITQYPQIFAFRNVLIQGYELVDSSLVWSGRAVPHCRAQSRALETTLAIGGNRTRGKT